MSSIGKSKGKDKGRFQIRILDNRIIQSEQVHLITLDVEASDTIDIVKTKFYLKTTTEPSEGEQLYFGLQLLVNDHTLSDYNIQQGYTLLAVSEEEIPYELYFCMEGQPELSVMGDSHLSYSAVATVETLKTNIALMIEEGFPEWGDWLDYNLDELIFGCNSIQLVNDHTLSDYDIQPGHVIVCNPKGKGKDKGKGKNDKGKNKGIGKSKGMDDPKCSNHNGNECHGIRQWFKCQHFQCYDTSKSILYCIRCGEEDLEPKIKNIMADHPMLKNARNEKDVKLISIMMYNKEG